MWVILGLFSTAKLCDPGRRSQAHKGKTICIRRLLRIADKCLIAIHLNELGGDFHQIDNRRTALTAQRRAAEAAQSLGEQYNESHHSR
jgi:hypothetical protein